jgi:hypothetical protein
MNHYQKGITFILLAVFFLAGCNPILGVSQYLVVADPLIIQPGHSVGQTFYSHHAGLNAIDIYLLPAQPMSGKIRLHLRSGPQSSEDLATSALTLTEYSRPGFVRFSFPTQPDSYLKDYYLSVENLGEQSIGFGYGPGDSFIEGAAYLDEQPLTTQLSFRLAYDPWAMGKGLAVQGITWLGQLLAAVFLLILPGWGLLSWLFGGWPKLSWLEKAGIAAGVSLAIYPILFLWTHLIHLQLGVLYAWLPPLVGIGYLLYKNRSWRPAGFKLKNFWNPWLHSPSFWPDLTACALIALIVLTRLWVIRPLEIPMWGDSYQHTMIAQLLVDNRGLMPICKP